MSGPRQLGDQAPEGRQRTEEHCDLDLLDSLPSASPASLVADQPPSVSPVSGDGDADLASLSLFPFDGSSQLNCHGLVDTEPDEFPIGAGGGLSSLLFQEDVEFSTSFSPGVSSAASHPMTTTEEKKLVREKALAVKRRRAHRERVKHQLHELRKQMVELSAHLQELQATHGDRVNDRATRLRIWKSIASRQEEARSAAVAQNRKLRAQVLHRQTQLRSLFNVLEKRSGCVDRAGGEKPWLHSENPTSGGLEPADSSLFDAFLGELDAAYAQTDEMLRSSGIARLSDQTSSQKVTRKWDTERGGMLFELVDSRVLPFSFVQTRSVLWQSIVRVHCRNPQEIYSRVSDPDNTIAVKCSVDCQVRSKNVTAPLVVYLVLRRYTESDRTVLVWRALSEGRGDVSGLYSDETGWTVLRPKTGSSVAGDGATTMETCTRFEPICSNASGASGAAISSSGVSDTDLFTSLLVNTVDQDNQDITHLMADLILKDLLAPHLSPVDSISDSGAP